MMAGSGQIYADIYWEKIIPVQILNVGVIIL